ncbi:UNVERIFIED_CONTAM: hypothetical protein FKN15_012792 [Acipenser sinensis]
MAVVGVTVPLSQQDLGQGAGTLKRTIRKFLQASNPTPSTPSKPFSPLKLTENGKTCILFWAKKLIVKLRNHTHVDLTDRAFSPSARVDLKGSSCSEEKAIFLLSNTYYESTAQRWFSLDSVHILYDRTKEASFNATQIYAPAVSSYHCQHVSSLHKYDMLLEPSSHGDDSLLWHITFIDFQTLLEPSSHGDDSLLWHITFIDFQGPTDTAEAQLPWRRLSAVAHHLHRLPGRVPQTLLKPSSHGDGSLLWHITFIDFQIQAFNVEGGRFSPASDCASFFTPAILMGLLMSLILLLVLAYALHMVLHLKSIEQLDEHRPSVYLESEAESEPGDKGQ